MKLMDSNKKNIWLQAYSHGNLGDDLFIYIITSRYPDCHFYLLCYDENNCLSGIPNLTILRENFLRETLRKIDKSYLAFKGLISKCDATVFLGGSMFIERSNWRSKLKFHNRLFKASKEFCLIGSNFGPYSSEEYLRGYEELFGNMGDCCFRDEYSAKLFGDLDNVRYAPDIAFTTDLGASVSKEEKSIAISVVNLKHKPELSKYYDRYVALLKDTVSYLADNNWKVRLLSFCDEHGDVSCCKDIIGDKDIDIIEYKGNLEEILQVLKESEYVIATRFHSMILGWLFGCKVYSFVYDEKMTNVLDNFRITDAGWDVRDENVPQIGEILDKAICLPDIEKVRDMAQQQFSYLDSLLKEKRK